MRLPHTVRPSRRLASVSVCAWLCVSATGAALAQTPPAPTPAAPPAATSGPPAPRPDCDANCVRGFNDRAAQACAPQIEAQAPIDFDWLQRPFGGIFQQGDTPDAEHPAIRYRGDSIRFQSPQKEWVRVSYECSYDPVRQKIVSVTVRLGRLDRPAAPPANAAAAAGARNGKPARAVRARPAPRQTIAPRAGEASDIEFFQVNPRASGAR